MVMVLESESVPALGIDPVGFYVKSTACSVGMEDGM